MEDREKKQQKSERRALIVKWVTSLAKGLGPPVADERVRFYSEALDDLTPYQLEHGFQLAKRHMGEFLPPVEQVREWAESYRPAGYEQTVKPLEKGDLTEAGKRA